MASTYSTLKLQLMTTGENTTTWGNVTNVNLGTALEEAIVGSADVTFASTTVTLTLTDTNASQTARNLRLNLTGTSGGAQNLIVPALEKVYIVKNGCADAITVKNSSGTGTAVPAGKTMWVYNDGTNVTNAITHLTSLTLAAALPVASGGTGVTTSTGSGNVVLSTSPTLVTPALGTPTSGNLASCTGVSLTTGVSGTLPVANGGTGVTTSTGSGNNVLSTSPTLVTPALGTPTSGNLASCTGVSLTTGVSGTLPVANGGTGATTLTGYIYGNGTSPLSASTTISGANITGNITGNAANVTGTVAVANGGTGLTTTPSNGFVDIGNGTGFTRAAITAGSGVTVTNGAGTITIAATGTGGTVTSVGGAGTVNGITLTGTVTSSGNLTLGGTLSGVSLTSQVTGTLPVANGGTGGTSQATAQSALGVPSTTGSGASGTWAINVSGNAATATNGITTGNIGSYAPGLTGSGASGTWGINITGNAATATNVAYSGLTGTVPTWNQNTTGNAATATTATNLSGGSVAATTITGTTIAASSSITAVGNITAYYSDDRLKTRLGYISGALAKVMSLKGFYYEANETAQALGYKPVREVGLSAQDVQAVLPEVIAPAPIDPQYLTLD